METPRPRLFERLKTGLEEGIRYAGGQATLRATQLSLPDPPRSYTDADIKGIRGRLNLSQALFAQVLCVSTKTIQSWEQGLRIPNRAAARLLQVIEDPAVLRRITRAATDPAVTVRETPRRASPPRKRDRRRRTGGPETP